MSDSIQKTLGHSVNNISSIIIGINHSEKHTTTNILEDKNPQNIVNLVDFCLLLLDKDGYISDPRTGVVYFNNNRIYDEKGKRDVIRFLDKSSDIQKFTLHRPMDICQFHINLRAIKDTVSKILLLAVIYQPKEGEGISTITLKDLEPIQIFINNKSSRDKDLLNQQVVTNRFINENCAILGEINITEYPVIKYDEQPKGFIVPLSTVISEFTRKV